MLVDPNGRIPNKAAKVLDFNPAFAGVPIIFEQKDLTNICINTWSI